MSTGGTSQCGPSHSVTLLTLPVPSQAQAFVLLGYHIYIDSGIVVHTGLKRGPSDAQNKYNGCAQPGRGASHTSTITRAPLVPDYVSAGGQNSQVPPFSQVFDRKSSASVPVYKQRASVRSTKKKTCLQWAQIRADCNMKACGVLTDETGSPLPGACKISSSQLGR